MYLVIDQGGHATRALVIDSQGQIHFQCERKLDTITSADGFVEHNPQKLIEDIHYCLGRIPVRLASLIKSAGLATQRSSMICWNRESGKALTPVISWQDNRAWGITENYSASKNDIRKITGLPLSPHYGAYKFLWCRKHLPEVRNAIKQNTLAWGPLSAYILFSILKEKPFNVDPVTASRTQLYDIQRHQWSDRLLSLFNIQKDLLPEIRQADYGHIHIQNQNIPLTVSTGDQQAALFINGKPRSNTLYINVGTGAFLQLPYHQTRTSLLNSFVIADKQSIPVTEGTVNGAGSAITWWQQLQDYKTETTSNQINKALDTRSSLLFLNTVSGLGSPDWISGIKPFFNQEGTPEQELGALLESIIFLIHRNLEILKTETSKIDQIRISGGLSQNGHFCQILSDLSKNKVIRNQVYEATAIGLAALQDLHEWNASFPVEEFFPTMNPYIHEKYRTWTLMLENTIQTANKENG